MKKTTIKIQEDLLNRINRYKYEWELKSHDAVIRRLFEICSKIKTANAKSQENSSTTSFLSSKTSESGAVHDSKEKEK